LRYPFDVVAKAVKATALRRDRALPFKKSPIAHLKEAILDPEWKFLEGSSLPLETLREIRAQPTRESVAASPPLPERFAAPLRGSILMPTPPRPTDADWDADMNTKRNKAKDALAAWAKANP